MSQASNTELLLRLHNEIIGQKMGLDEIMKDHKIDPKITFMHDTELCGKVASGSTISVEEYYTLEDKLDYGASRGT
jgi:hypothetical protein